MEAASLSNILLGLRLAFFFVVHKVASGLVSCPMF